MTEDPTGAARTVVAPRHHYLFNFSVSWSGGGYKRLYEYARLFHTRGGAWFVAHPTCRSLADEFPNNRFFFPNQPRYQRLYDDCGYLRPIVDVMGMPALYYSYGIPLYWRVGRLNWFHLSNVLALTTRGIPLNLMLRLKIGHVGRATRRGFQWADVISAESRHSLSLIPREHEAKLFLSVNGSDDELQALANPNAVATDNALATMVGTHVYKGLDDGVRIFEMLRVRRPDLRLHIIGNQGTVPRAVQNHPGVTLCGTLPRSEVIDMLARSRFYLSMTHVENSWNAASEGIFLAAESYLSGIEPHRELLRTLPVSEVPVPGVRRTVLHVTRGTLTGVNLSSWETIVDELDSRVRLAISGAA